MKIAVITIGRSGSSELLKILEEKTENKDIIPKPNNHLYPEELYKNFGPDIKVIFITRNIKEVIQSLLQRNKDKGIEWIKKHYKNLNSQFSDYKYVLIKDTLNFEKLYDSYNKQKLFDVLFIKYENLYFNHQETINQLSEFISFELNPEWFKYNENNNWKGNYNGKINISVKWDNKLQKKIDSYEYKLLLKDKKIKMAHIINPFKCPENNPSYLYYAQPITFKSMKKAMNEADISGIDIELWAANFKEDNSIVPNYFNKLPNLKKSTKSLFPQVSGNKKLPIISEMFNLLLQNSEADYIIFTNSDIGLYSNFYKKIYNYIKNDNLEAFVINRRDNIPKFINGKRLTEKDLDLIFLQKGEEHIGKDCFIISRDILKKINMGNMYIGYPPWGHTLYKQMKKYNQDTKIFKKEYLTFHLGQDRAWKNEQIKNILWSLNERLASKLE